MASDSAVPRTRLSIAVNPELRQQIRAAAAQKDQSVRDYVLAALKKALADDRLGSDATADTDWAQLSTIAFARDWECDEDSVYDSLP
jgi:hypothetical protein